MHDILRESPFYQEILQEGREEGLQEGKLEGVREVLISIVQARFPRLVRLTKGLAAITEDTGVLQKLILKISLAQTLEEAQQYLIEVDEEDSN